MIVRILTEGQKGLGMGHIVRCYNLARYFVMLGYDVDFWVRGDIEFCEFIEKQGAITHGVLRCYPLKLQWEEIRNPTLLACDICILDSYVISDFSLLVQSVKVLVLFDDDGRHLPFLQQMLDRQEIQSIQDSQGIPQKRAQVFLLNPNGFYARQNVLQSQKIWQSLKEHIFSGLEYAPLNPCFQAMQKEQRERVYDFFVCLGGEDLGDRSALVFEQLKASARSVIVVVGASYQGSLLQSPYLCDDENEPYEDSYQIWRNVTQERMAFFMRTARCCIVSGGGIVFEAIMLCPKVFALNLASNQDKQLEILASQGLLTTITLPLQEFCTDLQCNKSQEEWSESNIGGGLSGFVSHLVMSALNETLQLKQQKKAQNFCHDGRSAIDFCNLSNDEALRVLEYRNHAFVREYMYGHNLISLQSHHNFLQSLQHDEHSRYFLVQDSEDLEAIGGAKTRDIGVISFSRINLKHKHAYLGIYKNPLLLSTQKGVYGHALMQMILHIAFCHYNFCMLYLEVVATNTRAIRFYEQEGFHSLGVLPNAFRICHENEEAFHDVVLYGIENPNR